MAKLQKLSDRLLNDGEFTRAKCCVFASDRSSRPSVNFAFIVLNRSGNTFLAEDTVIFLDAIRHTCLLIRCEVRDIKVVAQMLAMNIVIVLDAEIWVDRIESGGSVFAFSNKATCLDLR